MVYTFAFELAISFVGFLGLTYAALEDFETGFVDVRRMWLAFAIQAVWALALLYFGDFLPVVSMLLYGTALYASARALESFDLWGNADTWALALIGTSSYSFGFNILVTLVLFGVPYAYYFGKVKGEEIRFVPAFAAAQLVLFLSVFI